jgi:hypothetical protein
MQFKDNYTDLYLSLNNLSDGKYRLIPEHRLQSIDFIMDGKPERYVGIERRVGEHSVVTITLGMVHHFFGNFVQARMNRKVNICDFRKRPGAHQFEYKDGIFNFYNEVTAAMEIATKIDREINAYEMFVGIKYIPSSDLSTVVGKKPITYIDAIDTFSDYVLSNNLVANSRFVYTDSKLKGLFRDEDGRCIDPEVVTRLIKENLKRK